MRRVIGQRRRPLIAIVALVAALVVLCLLFPRVLAFAERGAREIRYLWWLVLIVLLGGWLVWGMGRKREE